MCGRLESILLFCVAHLNSCSVELEIIQLQFNSRFACFSDWYHQVLFNETIWSISGVLLILTDVFNIDNWTSSDMFIYFQEKFIDIDKILQSSNAFASRDLMKGVALA